MINQSNRQIIDYSRLNQEVNELEDSRETAVQGNLCDSNVTSNPTSSSSKTSKEKEKGRETNAENFNKLQNEKK